MTTRIEDYALIGDCQSGALVGRDGSIDWLCVPRFDSDACFAALLGTPEHGRWLIQPAGEIREVRRRYRDGTLILETDFRTDDGEVTLIDFMPLRNTVPDVCRIIRGRRGTVRMRFELVIRHDTGQIVPWVRRADHGLVSVAGPDAMHLYSHVELHGEDFRTVGTFDVHEGEQQSFVLVWQPSHEREHPQADAEDSLRCTEQWWREWSGQCTYEGAWREAVLRSAITLKALTFAPTGGMVAALTTSLPECLGGERNWDYRYCWLRDATFTLLALMKAGYTDEACAWRDWLLRAIAGKPSQIQPIYGLAGERRLIEYELPWLPGYENSRPVRFGNGATTQFQLDVFGEIMDMLHMARREELSSSEHAWDMQRALMRHLETIWTEPDEGIWEVRGPRRHFTHSKVLAWVAVDRAINGVEHFGLSGPLDRWRQLRRRIHDEICQRGFNSKLNAFTQSFNSAELDAAALIIPLVGFLPPEDPRVRGTVAAVQRHLLRDGFVLRYDTHAVDDGLSPGEGAFLLCTFWLADNLAMIGRIDEAREIYERLLAIRNEVGLLAEEYDPVERRFLGNFPQAFSHVALINTAANLSAGAKPSEERSQRQ